MTRRRKAPAAPRPSPVPADGKHAALLGLTLALMAAVLWVHRDIYWRPFDDHPQESTVSYHAFGFAAANGAGLWPNPVVARQIDIRESRIVNYTHWPNGFFLAFEAVLQVFGRTETVGRWVAILGTLAGFTLLVISVERAGPLLYLTLPVLLLSSAGRDSVGFIFIDVALNLWAGLLLAIPAHLSSRPWRHRIFRAAMILAVFSNQLIVPFAAGVILIRWQQTRSRRGLLIDLAVLASATIAVLALLAAGMGSLEAGRAELVRIFRIRSSTAAASWLPALDTELRHLFHLGPAAGSILVIGAWAACVRARQWRVAMLLPGFLALTLLLRQYIAGHHFARLPFVLYSLITVAVAVELLAGRLGRLRNWTRLTAAGLLVAGAVAGRQQYEVNRGMQITRGAILTTLSDPRQQLALEQCNQFQFHPDYREEGFDPLGLMGQFYFGPQVVQRVRRGEPRRPCTVDLETFLIRPGAR